MHYIRLYTNLPTLQVGATPIREHIRSIVIERQSIYSMNGRTPTNPDSYPLSIVAAQQLDLAAATSYGT